MTDIYKGKLSWVKPLPEGFVAEKFEIAARALIVFEGRALFVYEEATDTWLAPGGKLTADEELRIACLREIDEETGLKSNIGNLVATWSVLMPRKGFLSNKFEYMFLASPVSPPDFIERDHYDADQEGAPVTKMKWFTAAESVELQNIFPPFLRQWPDLLLSQSVEGA